LLTSASAVFNLRGEFEPGAGPALVNDYVRGKDFNLAAFKGQKVTFRSWDGQLRQPGPDLPVSMSPQLGFVAILGRSIPTIAMSLSAAGRPIRAKARTRTC
jgi:hypothetical protein